ncbi:hypothetical protein [Zavarzinella formosa]|uniref:hypothetical protein n=1 Tax=Zavarzinella formosa TaxID=360055 RepID=UPI00031E3F52|nr:hypothetical protein [Zavarzinella formosa]
MNTNLPAEPPADDPVNDPIPRYTASDTPVTKLTRWAFQIWVICFLFTLVFTLMIYLIDKFRGTP